MGGGVGNKREGVGEGLEAGRGGAWRSSGQGGPGRRSGKGGPGVHPNGSHSKASFKCRKLSCDVRASDLASGLSDCPPRMDEWMAVNIQKHSNLFRISVSSFEAIARKQNLNIVLALVCL